MFFFDIEIDRNDELNPEFRWSTQLVHRKTGLNPVFLSCLVVN